MKKLLLFLASLIIGIILFIWVLNTVGPEEIKEGFLIFTRWEGLAILFLTILITLIANLKWKEILKGLGAEIRFRDLLKPFLAGYSIMIVAPVIIFGGELLRAYYLREKYSVPWPKGMASVVIDRALEWTANLTVVFLGSMIFLFLVGVPQTRLVIIFVASFLVFFVAIILFFFKALRKESIVRFLLRDNRGQPLETEKEMFAFFKLRSVSMWKAIFLSYLRAFTMFLRSWFLLIFLGKYVTALVGLTVLAFNYLAVMVPIPVARLRGGNSYCLYYDH